jgi:phage-related protein
MGHMLIPGGLVDIGTKTKRLRIRTLLATLLGAALLCSISAIANGQSGPAQPAQRNLPGRDDDATRRQLADMDQFLDSHPEISEQLRKDPSLIRNGEFVGRHPALQEFLQQHPNVREQFSQNPNAFMHQEERFDRRDNNHDIHRELADMDQFLDSHPEINEQLRKDPSLIRKGAFVDQHPALQEFLQQHPGVRDQFSQDPNAFMHREERFDQRDRDNDHRDNDHGINDRGINDHGGNDHGIDHRELADMDQFLDSHPEVSEQLRRDPSLIRKGEFVDQHPALQEFLQQHPNVREQFSQNPNAFMHQEERFDRRDDSHDIHRELTDMDQFLDSHPEISEQLRKDPSLIRKGAFVDQHPSLQEFLQQHPGVRDQFSQNPNAFMHQEERFDQRENDHYRGADNRVPQGGDHYGHQELSSFGEFLGGHSSVAEQLSKDPTLANNKEYVANHPELGEYLKAHPAMSQQLAQNPQGVMSSNWVQQATNTTPKASAPKPKPNQ